MSKVPRGLFGGRNGVGDPEALTPTQRPYAGEDRAAEQQERRTSGSPLVRALQAATDRALGGR